MKVEGTGGAVGMLSVEVPEDPPTMQRMDFACISCKPQK